MQLAHNINQELTVEQAIADKTAMVNAEIENAERAQLEAFKIDNEGEQDQKDDDLDDLDFIDEEEAKLMRSLKEQRLAAMKEEY